MWMKVSNKTEELAYQYLADIYYTQYVQLCIPFKIMEIMIHNIIKDGCEVNNSLYIRWGEVMGMDKKRIGSKKGEPVNVTSQKKN